MPEVDPDPGYSYLDNRLLQAKYKITAWFYDILDYPWERQYRKWRPGLLQDVHGRVFEAGVGTGRNLKYYSQDVELTGIDLSAAMLNKARKRVRVAACRCTLLHQDASVMGSIPSEHFDWLISTFMCCVMPDELQPSTIEQFGRILRPGGRFRLLEMVYSKDPKLRKRQELFTPFVEKVYGARFDRDTLGHLENASKLKVDSTYCLKEDIYLVIEGERLD